MIKYMDTMVIIDDKIVSSEIFTEYFACDYGVCGGACCIIGDSGAPMEEDEPERIEANYGRFSPLMSPEGRAVVEEKGFFEVDSDGDMVTPLVPGREECAYAACDEDGSWFCTAVLVPRRIGLCQAYLLPSLPDPGLQALQRHDRP